MGMDDTLDVDELVSQHLAVGSETNLSALTSAADQLERRTENVRSLGTPLGFAARVASVRPYVWRVWTLRGSCMCTVR
jgi:hypothetical protein